MAQLRGFPDLEALSIENTQVTDAVLSHLKCLPKLRLLYLQGTHITDEGLLRLRGLKNLEFLAIGDITFGGETREPLVTAEGVKHFKQAMPKLGVSYYRMPPEAVYVPDR